MGPVWGQNGVKVALRWAPWGNGGAPEGPRGVRPGQNRGQGGAMVGPRSHAGPPRWGELGHAGS
eukprot:3391103-Lingulodinium_polyedra.AAC.1